MPTLQQILESFDEMTPLNLPIEKDKGYVSLIEKDQWLKDNSEKHLYEDYTYPEPELDLSEDKIKSFLTSTYKSIIEGEIERLSQKIKDINNKTIIPRPQDEKERTFGYTSALQDQINYLQNKLMK